MGAGAAARMVPYWIAAGDEPEAVAAVFRRRAVTHAPAGRAVAVRWAGCETALETSAHRRQKR